MTSGSEPLVIAGMTMSLSVVDQARAAAAGKAVTVVGRISTIRHLLRERLVDEWR